MATSFQFLISLLLLTVIHSVSSDCTFKKHNEKAIVHGEGQIELLKGKRFRATNDPDYDYDIGICVDAVDTGEYKGVGVLQTKRQKDGEDTAKPIVIGEYDDTDIVAGNNWVLLEYGTGQSYTSHCGNENRKAKIMLTCDPDVDGYETPEKVLVVREEANKTSECFYLFEVTTSVVCEKQPFITVGLSVGSVLLIVFFSVLAVYLIAGFLYNRFVLGAKGVDQIPNRSFWQDFGNLQADGCDLVCRARRAREPKTYKGIGDDQLQDEETTDEHLLPM